MNIKYLRCDDGKRLYYSTCSVIARSFSLSNAHKSRAHTRQTQPTLINNSHRLVCRLPLSSRCRFFIFSFCFQPTGSLEVSSSGIGWLPAGVNEARYSLFISDGRSSSANVSINIFLFSSPTSFSSVTFRVFILDVLFWRFSVCQSVPHNNLRRSELLFFHFGSLLSCLFLLNDWQYLFSVVWVFFFSFSQILFKIEPIKSFFF